MKRFHKVSPTAKKHASLPSEAPDQATIPEQPPLDLKNPEHTRAWLHAMQEAIADIVAVAREGTRRVKHRVLSRAERRRQAREAEGKLAKLMERAEAMLLG